MNTSIFTMLLRYNIQLESFWSFFDMWNILYNIQHRYAKLTLKITYIHQSDLPFRILERYHLANFQHKFFYVSIIFLYKSNAKRLFSYNHLSYVCLQEGDFEICKRVFFVNIWEIFAGFS